MWAGSAWTLHDTRLRQGGLVSAVGLGWRRFEPAATACSDLEDALEE